MRGFAEAAPRPDRVYPLAKHQEYACVYDWEGSCSARSAAQSRISREFVRFLQVSLTRIASRGADAGAGGVSVGRFGRSASGLERVNP